MSDDPHTSDPTQVTLARDTSRRQVARPGRDGLHVVCPDCGVRVGYSNGGGKPLPGTDAEAFGWECRDCDLTLPARCHGPEAPHFNDRMAGLRVEFRDGTERFVPVPRRYLEADGGAA